MKLVLLPWKIERDLSEQTEELLIGTDPRCDIIIDSKELPPIIAKIFRKNNRLLLKSELPFIANGKKTKKIYLDETTHIDFEKFSIQIIKSIEAPFIEIIENFLDEISTFELDNEILEKLLNTLLELTGAEKALLYHLEEKKLVPLIAVNMSDKEVIEFSDTLLKEALQKKEPILVNRLNNHPLFSRSKSLISSGISSFIVLPLLVGGEMMGLIYLASFSTQKIFTPDDLRSAKILSSLSALIIRNLVKISELKTKTQILEREVDSIKFSSIIGTSTPMREIFKIVEKVSKVDVPVLILGETGTGKELIAREIHRLSQRSKYPFITVNCGAIPVTLLESELFGYVKGAFTGAFRDKKGKFHLADKGTLFLDEIGDLDLSLQVKLLRVLQDGIVYRIGSETPEKVDVRIIAATNKNLEKEINEGTFREDLFYRLNVITINLPPLRNRKEDIILIAKYFFEKYRKELNPSIKGFTKEALISMENYNWPGNIREMENRIKKALVLSEGEYITPEDLDFHRNEYRILTLAEARERFQEEYIEKILLLNNGNRTKTAKDLGVDPRTIFRYLEKKKKKENITQ